MSEFSDRLSNLGQSAPLKLGFGQLHERKRNPVMFIVGLLDAAGKGGGALEHADIALLRARKGGRPATAVPDGAGLWGVSLSDCTAADLGSLKESGCDFMLIESDSAPGITLSDDGLGRGMVLPADLTEPRARAIEDLPFDFLLVRGMDLEWPLTVAQVVAVQEKVSTFSKHIFLEIAQPPDAADLPLLRDMPVSGLVLDLASQDAGKLEALKKAIAELEPRKQRTEHVALLPSSMAASISGHSHEAEPDEDDDYGDGPQRPS